MNIYYIEGFLILFLNKIRYSFFGYNKPRDFSSVDISKAINYDLGVVQNWENFLKKYSKSTALKGKRILELGPGADLGAGLILLSKGVSKYYALDVNNLAIKTPDEFYIRLLEKIKAKDDLFKQVSFLKKGKPQKLNYVIDKSFDLNRFSGIDIVFSQAAFEHFDDFRKLAKNLRSSVKKDSIMISEIDLSTHTGLLAKKDPLNIYRYPKLIYNLFKFPGIPNRLRPKDYVRILSENGWKDIKIFPKKILKEKEFKKVKGGLSKEFRRENSQMRFLSVMLCAKKK